jgi:hypothetical protein
MKEIERVPEFQRESGKKFKDEKLLLHRAWCRHI